MPAGRSRARPAIRTGGKRPFRFGIALPRIRHELQRRALADAAMFELADRGHRSVFEQLVACMISHEAKAQQIRALARRTVEEFDGTLPCDGDVLTSFPGVGPKCANLALGIACGQARISVDVHVHRVTNRWGVIATRSPEQSMVALEEILPRRYRVELNRLLVPFGKHVCTGVRPHCSTCPVLDMCRQVGVTSHR